MGTVTNVSTLLALCDAGTLYIIQEREFKHTSTYKIGRAVCVTARHKQYSKGSTLMFTTPVNLDYIFLIAKIASMDYSKTSFIYNSLHNMRKDTSLNKTVDALWGDKHDKQWLCDYDQHLYKRVIKFTSKHGSLEILGPS